MGWKQYNCDDCFISKEMNFALFDPQINAVLQSYFMKSLKITYVKFSVKIIIIFQDYK